MRIDRFRDAWVIRPQTPEDEKAVQSFMNGLCQLATGGLRGSSDSNLFDKDALTLSDLRGTGKHTAEVQRRVKRMAE